MLDPFCGCATTLVAAESLGREWAGIDLSPLAVTLVDQRLRDSHGVFRRSSPERTCQPARTWGDPTGLPDPQAHAVRRPGGALYRLPHPLPIPQPHHRPRGATGQGRTGQPGELQLLCGACNSKKGTGSQAALVAKLKQEGLR